MGNMGGPAMPIMAQMAPKEGVEHISAADLLTVPTAQVLRLPDGHTVTVPFPPAPPEAPLEINPAEIRSAAMLDHSADILKVLGGLAGNKSAAKTLQSFAKSEHLPKNFVQDWQKHPEKLDDFIQNHASDPNLGKILSLMEHDHVGAQVFKDVAADIDNNLKSYNDEVSKYEADYSQYQQAFTDHMTMMKSEILPQLVAAGVIPEAQANHLMANLADNGGSIDFSQVAPDALVQPSDGTSQDGSGTDGGIVVTDESGNDGSSQVASPDDPQGYDSTGQGSAGSDQPLASGAGDSGGSDFLTSFMATLNADGSSSNSAGGDSGASDSAPSYTDATDSNSADSGASSGDNVDWSSVGYDSSAVADDNSAPSDPASSSGDNPTNG